MNTKFLFPDDDGINEASSILKNGGLVGLPTETVYGLAADALNPLAVNNIFKAKGRPNDNPLIVHIANFESLFPLVLEVPEKAKILSNLFWPGPLTMIFKKSNLVPMVTSGNLDTVAIRMPDHPVAKAVIETSKLCLAAPSANISGSPSPTSAKHVLNDLNGKIDAVIDGGNSSIGLESTVITFENDYIKLLRPGFITVEQLEHAVGKVLVDDAVLNGLKDNSTVSSPGMKYKHYAPKANVIIVKANSSSFINFINNHNNHSTLALCYEEDKPYLNTKTLVMGKKDDYQSQARLLFSLLRDIDIDEDIKTVYARCPKPVGLGLALYNRLIRASGFEVIELD